MLKKDLQKQLKAVKNQIKSNFKDARLADKLISDLLSIKGQIDIKPIEVIVESEDVIFRHNYNHFELIKTSNEVIYAASGYKLIVKEYSLTNSDREGSTLFDWLTAVCNFQQIEDDPEKQLSEDEQTMLNHMIYALDTICQIPLLSFIKENIMMEMIKAINNNLHFIVEEAMSLQLQSDDEVANEKYKSEILNAEKLVNELKNE